MDSRERDNKKLEKAVALGYIPGKDGAPRVLASGKGTIAEAIAEIAREHGVPFYQDAALVDSLINLQINAEIPLELYEAIAHVLAYVYSLDIREEKSKKE
jgi:flagellar biosynthesis protein